ncbi:MAG: hypothetical protein AB7L09_00435 [Nitrospira sp.]
MRLADIPETLGYRSQVRECDVEGCSEKTREGKQYCLEHLELNPYAAKVMADIAQRDADDAYAVSRGAVPENINTEGVTAMEILHHLAEHGARTKERLCRELCVDREVVDAYTEALRIRGWVLVGQTCRRNETLTLARPL